MTNQALRITSLLLVLAIVAFYKFGYLARSEESSNTIHAAALKHEKERVAAMQRTANAGLPLDYQKLPESGWRNNDNRRAAKYLGQVDTSLLVLPVQGDINALDPIERSLISRLVVASLNQQVAGYAADAGKVLEFLGNNRPSYSPSDVRNLAAITRAEHILELHAEHDRVERFKITATLKPVYGSQPVRQQAWEGLYFDDEQPPSRTFVDILPEVSKFASGNRTELQKRKSSFSESTFAFPESFVDLVERSEESPVHAAAYLQMLGMLHPRGMYNEARDHLFERSLVELEKVSSDVPFARYFTARAYAYLDRRPAAVAVLRGRLDRHEQALLDALNGNLPNLRSYFRSDDTSVLQFMALKDFLEIGYWYSADPDQALVEKFTEDHEAWAPLLFRSLRDFDLWAQYSAATLKFALETLLPSETVSLEDHYTKLAVVGDVPDELELTRLLWQHLEDVENATVKKRSQDPTAMPVVSETDILDLVRSLAVANHIHEVDKDLSRRALPHAAHEELSRFDSFYAGHPEVTLLKGRVLKAMAEKSTGAESTNLRAAAREAEMNGFAWTGRITPNAAQVARTFAIISGSNARYRPGAHGPFVRYSRRYFEWPKGSGWSQRINRTEQKDGALDRCIEYVWTSFHCVRWKIDAAIKGADNADEIRTAILAQYADRFSGHPQRDEYHVELARDEDNGDAEIQAIQSKIAAGSTDQSLYFALGKIFKRRGEYERAQQAWLSYPGYQPADRRLELSEVTTADNAAAMLFWIGQYELAMPLLELAASSPSGSASSMTSAVRIALINGDYESAVTWSAHRVRRYNSKYALRDFLQLLHILGQSETAWSTFEQFSAVQENSQMWSGALVGHRQQSASIDEILAWIQNSAALRTASTRATNRQEPVSLAARYLLQVGTMDRVPDANLAQKVADANARPKPVFMHTNRPPDVNDDSRDPIPFAFVKDGNVKIKHDDSLPMPRNTQRAAHEQEIDHRYTMLARAMTAFLNDDFAEAYKLFNETAYFYYLDEYLPYYAFSASKLEQAEHISSVLAAREPGFAEIRRKEALGESNLGYRFNEDLTYAVIAGLSGDHEVAISRLQLALNNRPYLEDRSVYPMYQVVDLADRLFEETGAAVYRDFALDLGRRHTVVLPMYAWAYFVVAKYSLSEVERLSAAASGLYLDPQSHRAAELDRKLIERAREFLEQSGPPFLENEGAARTEST